jgi:hypothetical protein
MKTHTSIHTLLKVALLLGASALTACPVAEEEDTGGTSDPSDGSTTVIDPDTTNSTSSTTLIDPDSTGSTSSSSDDSTTIDPDAFVFPTNPYDDYTQIDRHGAVEAGTAGILAPEGLGFNPGSDITLRDAYNASNPLEDEGGMWLDEIIASVTFFHTALDDDLMGLGLTVASVNQGVMQAGPVIVPDTIKYDPSIPTAYPNGRTLEDQVVDITFAAVLLDLTVHPLDAFATFPLNPITNDVPFEAEFPYLAAPHVR